MYILCLLCISLFSIQLGNPVVSDQSRGWIWNQVHCDYGFKMHSRGKIRLYCCNAQWGHNIFGVGIESILKYNEFEIAVVIQCGPAMKLILSQHICIRIHILYNMYSYTSGNISYIGFKMSLTVHTVRVNNTLLFQNILT